MASELMWVGGVVIALAGVVGAGGRRVRRPGATVRTVRAIRAAMSGPEGGAVRAEFQRRGVQPPEARSLRPGYLWPAP